MFFLIEIIQVILLLISAFLIIVASVGLMGLDKNLKNVVYAKIHIFGLVDIACIIALIALNQFILAGIYFILAPFTAHAIANAYFKREDNFNNPQSIEVDPEPSPFIHPKSKLQKLENNDLNLNDKLSISTLEIREDE